MGNKYKPQSIHTILQRKTGPRARAIPQVCGGPIVLGKPKLADHIKRLILQVQNVQKKIVNAGLQELHLRAHIEHRTSDISVGVKYKYRADEAQTCTTASKSRGLQNP